jgi:threonine aldolase
MHLGISLEEFIKISKADILSLGGTKNGLMGTEALLIFNPTLEEGSDHLQKQTLQLMSKMRYLSAQYIPFFKHDLWKTLATHANQKAKEIGDIIKTIPQLNLSYPVETNQVFFTAPASWIPLIEKEFYCYIWDREKCEVRMIASWNTSEEEINALKSALTLA